MTTSIHNLAISHNSVAFGNADTNNVFSPPHENRVFNNWQYADNEMLNGFLKHSNPLLAERCRYNMQELKVPQSDCNRIVPAVFNGSCFSYMQQGIYNPQGLALNHRVLDHAVGPKQVPRTWHSENSQDCHNFVEEIQQTFHGSTKYHSFGEASHLVGRNSEAATSLSGTVSVRGIEPCWETSLQSSSHNHEGAANIRAGSSAHDDNPCIVSSSLCEPEAGAVDASVVPVAPKGRLWFESASEAFSRSSRRSNMYRRRAMKKMEIFNFDTLENRTFTPPSKSRSAELAASTSQCPGPVVESPNWLPQGWFTEMKTRASGNSAGCKYKCYVDPVTKRRFRTRKEVFCFLATGNTGRYKPRHKMLESGKSINSDYNFKHSVFGWRNLLQGPKVTDYSAASGTHVWPYRSSGRCMMVNIQAAALKLLTDDDDMTLEDKAKLFARFSPRPGDFYGLRIQPKNLKRVKAQGKQGLEALGKVICQQGLSILRKCNE